MCMAIPMQVTTLEPGHACCICRGETRRVRTALVGEPCVGDWLLVFIDNAVEIIGAHRAAEISATLDLLALAGAGMPCDVAPSFALPSAMDREHLMALAGGRAPAVPRP